MKKKLIAIIAMACVAAFVLSACGGGSSNNPPAGGSGTQNGSGAAAPQAAAGETFDVGDFTVAVPSGWTAFTQTSPFGEKDADGNPKVLTDQIVIAKGATNNLEALTGPMVRIYHHAPSVTIADSRSFYDNPVEITGIKVNGVDCSGFTADSSGYVYDLITYEAPDAKYEINILKSVNGKDSGISWEDPDVMAIMESLTAKAK